MQKDQVVVATFGKCALGANPENALLKASESSCGLRFGEVTIPSFVILHARLGDEWLPVGERAHYIGQVVMGFIFKCVANGACLGIGSRYFVANCGLMSPRA